MAAKGMQLATTDLLCSAAWHKKESPSSAHKRAQDKRALEIYALSGSTILDTQHKLHKTATGNRRSLSSDQYWHDHYPCPLLSRILAQGGFHLLIVTTDVNAESELFP